MTFESCISHEVASHDSLEGEALGNQTKDRLALKARNNRGGDPRRLPSSKSLLVIASHI
jgi:hypothetical protein